MSGRYDPTLVAASVLIAVFSAYAALALASRVAAASGRFRLAWLVGVYPMTADWDHWERHPNGHEVLYRWHEARERHPAAPQSSSTRST